MAHLQCQAPKLSIGRALLYKRDPFMYPFAGCLTQWLLSPSLYPSQTLLYKGQSLDPQHQHHLEAYSTWISDLLDKILHSNKIPRWFTCMMQFDNPCAMQCVSLCPLIQGILCMTEYRPTLPCWQLKAPVQVYICPLYYIPLLISMEFGMFSLPC